MKYVMESLKHNGIYVPPYDCKGFKIKIQGQTIILTEKSEPMAVAWVRRILSTTMLPPDQVFTKNFMKEFLEQLKRENINANFLEAFTTKYIESIDNPASDKGTKREERQDKIDFSEIKKFILDEKAKKEVITKEEKKTQAEERKVKKLEMKEKFGYAEVDGRQLEVANWISEPSCLFAGRGDHPQRGKWKEGPKQEDITLNLSPDAPKLEGWKNIWEPDKMYVAKWIDKLTGKVKYVWFSDTAFLKQDREREKFQKAENLGKQIGQVEKHIRENLRAKELERRKVATVAWLIFAVNMRVGDEKDPDEADTVGAITLRDEHISIEGDAVTFDFLGKDSVRWVKTIQAELQVVKNLNEFKKDKTKQYLFEGIDSKKVSRFLSEKVPKLTAKVFRTWKCTKTLKEELDKSGVTKVDPEYKKNYAARMANLKVAEVANHKRKIPPTFDERVKVKEENLKAMQTQLKAKKNEGKKTETFEARIEKAKLDLELTKLTREYNLGTSLKSYIDPQAYVKWAKKVKFDIIKFYPTTLRNKYSWALQQDKTKKTASNEE
ncbi:MAG: DNA topoisomerase I [Candidatus Bathyarchaeota archaeon]|uniref:DNA topoisomerase I n=1 Tax=Candidatus Bathycorpusculum sp. TaxID=2994959 RepID=UPI00281D9EB4|nr:DNA topoisomerase I [Candidatus Termiticorpusculum sp.]MCL2292715.1 DNA topoisomerase I [Candidatus Termiticorpusculum sp.]